MDFISAGTCMKSYEMVYSGYNKALSTSEDLPCLLLYLLVGFCFIKERVQKKLQ